MQYHQTPTSHLRLLSWEMRHYTSKSVWNISILRNQDDLMHAQPATRWQPDEGRESASPGLSHKRGSSSGPAWPDSVLAFLGRGRGNLMIGSVIGGHIRVLGALGQGGMGEVYAGVDERLGRNVAIKAIRGDRSEL